MALLDAEVPEQKIEFWSRNIRLGEVTLKEPKASFSIPLNGLKLGEDFPVVLRLRMPFARSPQELHISDDPRKLAVGLVSVRFDNWATPNYVVVERGQTLTFRNGENRGALIWGWSRAGVLGRMVGLV